MLSKAAELLFMLAQIRFQAATPDRKIRILLPQHVHSLPKRTDKIAV